MTPPARTDRPGLGLLLVLAAVAMFTAIDASAKWLTQAGLGVAMVVFVRYAVHLALVGAAALGRGERGIWRMKRPGLTLIRGFMLILATGSNFVALQYLPLTVTVSIFFVSPLLVTAAAALFLGEVVGPRRWAAIGVGLLGVLIVTQPWGARFHWAMALCLAMPAATAVYVLLTRRLSGIESASTMQFWAAAQPTLLFAPFALLEWRLPEAPADWAFFALIGVAGWGGHQCWTLAYRHAEASALAPFQYAQIVFMAAASWLLFAQPPDAPTLAGASLVMASGLYVWLRERALSRRGAP